MIRLKGILKILGSGFLIVLSVLVVVFAVIWGESKARRFERELPKISIKLADTTLEEVHEQSKRIKYDGNKLMVDWRGGTKEFFDVEFKGHGNTAWEADKKSYRIKLAGRKDLIGLGEAKKWVLIANYDDDSLLRNDLGLYISQLLSGSPINGKFVLLNINDEDLGVYYLTKALDIGKDVINLNDPYGVLVEYDSAYGDGEDFYYQTKNNGLLTIKDAVIDDNEEYALKSFGAEFDELEAAAEKYDYEKVKSLIDVESFAEYFIISEFAGNPDAYLTSFYMNKDGFGDKIHAGIGWDFDAAFGNRNWGSGEGDFYAPKTMMARRGYAFKDNKNGVTRLFYYLIEIPEFYELVCNIYQEKLMGNKEDVLSRISRMAETIRDEAILDSELWQKGNFDDEVEYLKWWVEVRFNVFNEIYGGMIKLPDVVIESRIN